MTTNSYQILGRGIRDFLTATFSLPWLRLQPRLERPLLRPDVYLPRARDLLLLVEQHLLPLRQPARHAADREQDGEEIRRERHRAVDQPGVEIDVRVQLP